MAKNLSDVLLGVSAGVLKVANGGTGAASLTGVLKGNGSSSITAALVGTDYISPLVAATMSGTLTLTGTSSVASTVLTNMVELTTISATNANNTVAFYIATQSVLFYTAAAAGVWTVNLTFSSGTTLNSALVAGQSVTVAFLVTQGGTPFYNTAVQVDGTTAGVSTKWQGGIAPTSGNANSIDVYTYTVIKTSGSAFTVLASITKFA